LSKFTPFASLYSDPAYGRGHLQVGGEIFEVVGEKWCKILAPFFYTYKGKFLQVKF